MAILTRKSVLAVVKETTEGTPVKPTAGTDYVALQPDFIITPSQESLTNDEIRDSIGIAKPIPGIKTPTATGSHYLRASGVEGQAPGYSPFLEACFGSVTVASTEYTLDPGSTTTTLQFQVGEAVNFQRGQAVLIKDAVNGYSIRALDSVDTGADTAELSFALDAAPASGVALGKATLYKPEDENHPTLSLWHYLGNGGTINLMSGSRVTDASTTITAGQLINTSYSFEGLDYYQNPLCVDATNDTLDWTDDAGTFQITVPQKVYAKPNELACTIQDAMNAASTETFTVTYSNSTGKFTFATDTSVVFSLLWDSGAGNAVTIGDLLGFDTATDDTGATSYDGDGPIDLASPYTISLDDADPLVAKNMQVLCGDQADNMCVKASEMTFGKALTRAQILSLCAKTGVDSSVISERAVSVSITSLLNHYDVDKYCRWVEATDTRMEVNFGEKDKSGNWVPGKCGAAYIPTGVITGVEQADQDGFVAVTVTGAAFVNKNGDGEVYMNFL